MCERQRENNPNKDTYANNERQGVSRIWVRVGEQQVRLDVVKKCQVSKKWGDEIKEKAGAQRRCRYFGHFFGRSTENIMMKKILNLKNIFPR